MTTVFLAGYPNLMAPQIWKLLIYETLIVFGKN